MPSPPDSLLELYRAITENELHTVENLLHNGVDPRLPIHRQGSESRPTSALETAIYNNRPEIVILLLQHRVSPNASGPNLAPLTIASMLGHAAIVRTLLEAGADPNGIDPDGAGTALMAAVEDGYLEVVDLLLKAGADPNLRDEGETALTIALAKAGRRKRIIRRLLEAGAVE